MEKVTFHSKDGLLITADYYKVAEPKSMILLCHRSHCNRAEYRETAPKFNTLGYSCLAIDQRSGMNVFGANNETKNRAKAQNLPTGYLDAKPDIEAGIDFIYNLNEKKPIILLGSSYSAALALMISSENKKIKAIIVFSPNEYLKSVFLAAQIKSIKIPIFATSAKKEISAVTEVFKWVNKKNITHFKPNEEGFHGSKILWECVKGFEQHWFALAQFLNKIHIQNQR